MSVRVLPSRRMFLKTATASLALPFLRSILPSKSALASAELPRVFLCLRNRHHGARPAEFFPTTASEKVTLGTLPWQGQHGRLELRDQDGRMGVSPVLSASSGLLSPRLVASMNVVQGLDYPLYAGHNQGFHLGGYCAEDTDHENWGPTLDWLLAQSAGFYPQLPDVGGPAVPRPLIHTTPSVLPHGGDPAEPFVLNEGVRSDELWSAIFPHWPGRRVDPEADKQNQLEALNDVHAELSRLKSRASLPGRRLSEQDRQRLDQHMDAIMRLQSRFACRPAPPMADLGPEAEALARADLTRAAIECGISRIFHYLADDYRLLPEPQRHRDTHQAFHLASPDSPEAVWYIRYQQQTFEKLVLPLVQALDFEDEAGRNVLDHSLVLWTFENGEKSHSNLSVPVVTFGSANGALSTGHYLDLRGPTTGPPRQTRTPGLLYDQLLGTILRAFGVGIEEYDRYRARKPGEGGPPIVGGYGTYSHGQLDSLSEHHSPEVYRFADEPLPLLFQG